MRYSYVLHFKNAPPFDRDPETSWNSFLGEFVKPLADKFPDLLFWCTFYGNHAKLRVYSDSVDVERFVQKQIAKVAVKFNPLEEIGETLAHDLGNPRFVDHSLGDAAVKRRAELTLRFLCATLRLYLDGLVSEGNGYWSYQKTKDVQNPEDHNFQSVHHLFCNISQVPTMVQEAQIPSKNGSINIVDSPLTVSHQISTLWDQTSPCSVSNPWRVHY